MGVSHFATSSAAKFKPGETQILTICFINRPYRDRFSETVSEEKSLAQSLWTSGSSGAVSRGTLSTSLLDEYRLDQHVSFKRLSSVPEKFFSGEFFSSGDFLPIFISSSVKTPIIRFTLFNFTVGKIDASMR
ncbi:hypothetical protein TNIN_95921 [Trichonephila inaurata madagascariensis]|uniref:Uncharacterized protein n=1 Tax=Trichonephila inaurata madagascariensis TaxID=2747483 RepID=A0A8X6K0N4_9ARAC|nr:hypothetical protein TNIN_95921 [Trichonephila inaurata madagascariensis]